jgi:hypothetical protein
MHSFYTFYATSMQQNESGVISSKVNIEQRVSLPSPKATRITASNIVVIFSRCIINSSEAQYEEEGRLLAVTQRK